MLQTRNGKRTAQAAIKVAVDLYEEKMLSKEEALLKVEPKQLDGLLHPMFDQKALKEAKVIANGLAASPGAGTGEIYFTAEEVSKAKKDGKKCILVRLETSPEDIEGMNDAEGILTIRGGMTSHAAVVARGMGRCCVSGCGELTINETAKTLKTKDGQVFKEGDYISLDGSTGNVYGIQIKTVEPEISGDFEKFMKLVDEVKVLGVRANADTPKDAATAHKYGAEGIGLCRTEHMFFEEDRIFAFRQMISSETLEQRETALEKVLPYQRSDFEGLFREMAGLPVIIRYLDPPLHEFLPHTDEEIKPLAKALGMTFEALKTRVESLKEFNPMMGHRGCRLAVTYPEIARMQTRAVIEAAINVQKEGKKVIPEIMIPLVGDVNELKYVKDIVVETADKIIKESKVKLHYQVGTMIEIPRAAILADEIAKEAEFFSFGTNDLTQMTFGFSRDDAGKFLNEYYNKGIFENDPFAKLDQNGVGKLVEMAAKLGKQTRPDIKLGICGEHGGEPSSVEFCHKVGLNYVSCSPYRVPIARLAAAQARAKEILKK
jgi:pyruvate,orthophosphate dikinase